MASVCGLALQARPGGGRRGVRSPCAQCERGAVRGTFLHAPVGIAEADVTGRYLRVNPRMCAITGYDERELLDLTYQAITHPTTSTPTWDSRRVVAGELDTYTLEKRYIRKDGAVVWVDLEVSASRDDDGVLTHLIAVVEDVTARKVAETALRQSEERFRAVFASIDEGYCLAEIVLDARGEPVDYRFLEVNHGFEVATGLVDAVGKTALELVPGLERSWIETYARVALEGETMRFEQASEAMGRWFDVFATPVEPRGRFALVFKDVTERRAAAQALEQSRAVERRSRRRAELLARVMGELEDVAGLEGRSRRLVDVIVPRVADRAVVEIPLPEDERPLRVVSTGPRESRADPDGDTTRDRDTHSRLVVPLAVGGARGSLVLGLRIPHASRTPPTTRRSSARSPAGPARSSRTPAYARPSTTSPSACSAPCSPTTCCVTRR